MRQHQPQHVKRAADGSAFVIVVSRQGCCVWPCRHRRAPGSGLRSAAFQSCCIADFLIGVLIDGLGASRSPAFRRFGNDTAGSEACATSKSKIPGSLAILLHAGAMALFRQHSLTDCLRTPGVLTAKFFTSLSGGIGRFAFALLKRCEEPLAGQLPVHALRPRILDRHTDVGRQMTQRDAGGNLVHVLAAGSRCPAERFLEFRFVQ